MQVVRLADISDEKELHRTGMRDRPPQYAQGEKKLQVN